MPPPEPPKIRLFCTDIDGTLIGNPESTERFRQAWEALPRGSRPVLVYNSGRTVADVRKLVAKRRLPAADFVIGGVGTELFNLRENRVEHEFTSQFGEGWDLAKIEAIIGATPGIERQPPEFLHPYKSSWYLHRADRRTIDELREHLREAGLDVHVVYSSLRDLDVLPSRANKGNALDWLCRREGVPFTEVLVAGDTANDSAMFLIPGVHGIVVENAQPDLLEAVVKLPVLVTRKILADGVLEGLKHFGVIPRLPPLAVKPGGRGAAWRGMLFGPDAFRSLRSEERGLIATGYEKALDALRRNITPLGFSACSLGDNTVSGTDVNYRSVWARDGCFTVVQTVEMDDPDIRRAQVATLRTLLDAIALNGQVPANVRIDDGRPEYSGVGGICSIDSGLWLVIAVYHYVTTTGDTALLSEYAAQLQKCMDWLSAHDSNNDGLIEIPEAGDWTDLFGRSYHVLYDEVLWYRANVCYGRLLEYQQDFDRAAQYLRWSHEIAGRIKAAFWPSTAVGDPLNMLSFAERQSSLGDTQYLLAEITPFAFNWRCDVLGNVLAFLTNVIDVDRARTAFRFMWGVGVNNPYPVANLYPVVQSGDPDWRAYYTVNLLNLPHHYHNGGRWPFIGGLWVRFVHRLGLHDLARNELVKLAQVNQLGRNQEWEFNEWVHGQTGRPMGKAYQAWSAAAYLRACQELHLAPGVAGDD